jgi:hypothetical protein
MTICVFHNGILAADTTTTNRVLDTRLQAVKLHRCKNTYTANEEKTLIAKWLCFSGDSSNLAGCLSILSTGISLNQFAEIIAGATLLISGGLSLGFLMDDGSFLHLSKAGKITPAAKTARKAMGGGSSLFKNGYDDDKTLSAAERTWLSARLIDGCGGDVMYVTPDSDELKVFNPDKQSIKRMTAILTKELLNKHN